MSIIRRVLLVLAGSLAGPAFAVSSSFAISPAPAVAASPAVFHVTPGSIPLSSIRLADDESLPRQILALKQASSASMTKVLRIGVGRDVPSSPGTDGDGLQWARADDGYAAHWRVSSRKRAPGTMARTRSTDPSR